MFQGKMTADGNFPKMDFSRAFSKLCYLLPSKFQKLEFSSTQSRVSGKVTIRHKFQVKGGKYKDTFLYFLVSVDFTFSRSDSDIRSEREAATGQM